MTGTGDATLSGADLRQTFGCFPSGVTAVCGLVDGAPVGMAASSFTSVSLDPPLVLFCVADTSSTWPKLRRSQQLGVSVLSSGQSDVSQQLSSRSEDRFAGVGWTAGDEGAVLIEQSAAWFVCDIHDTVSAGDHDVILLRIVEMGARPELEPLVFHASRYREVA